MKKGIEKMRDLPPMDDFQRDKNHQEFERHLRMWGRLVPRKDDDLQLTLPDEATRPKIPTAVGKKGFGLPTSDSIPPPKIALDEKGNVQVKIGRDSDILVSYPEQQPGQIRVSSKGEVADAVIAATATHFTASARLRDPNTPEKFKHLLKDIKIKSAADLLVLGRPDVVQASRLVFSSPVGDMGGKKS